MDQEMIERCAQALYAQSGMTYSDVEYWHDMALAVIKAMKP